MPADSELDVESRIASLWGADALPTDAGVLHVVATWFDGTEHRVLRITPESPKSETDFFVLNLARARADVIITTGRILREEPSLEYSLPSPWAAPMLRWREGVMGRTAPPRLAVLTSGRGLDPGHPALHGWASPVVVTSPDAARALRGTLPEHVDVIGLQSTSIRDVLAWARADGATTISVEAGPSTARALYADPLAVDELSWSQFAEPDLAHDFRGAALFSGDGPPTALHPTAPPKTLEQTSGSWRFSRWVAAAPG